MNTAGPTAGSAHATPELGERFLDPDSSRFRLLAARYPADPLIACQRRNVFPRSLRSRRRRNGFL